MLELDARKLSQRYRIRPVEIENIWAMERTGNVKHAKASELFEEYVVGDIKPVDRYLVAIHITKQTADEIRNADSMFPENDFVKKLLKHRLLKIDGKWANK